MKTWKLISMLLLAFMVGACDDDPAVEEGNGGGAGSGSLNQVSASWGIESKTVLKNVGQVLLPVKLSNSSDKAVKVTVAAQQSDDAAIAREGIDFDLPEKVVTFPAGDTLAFLSVDLLDNGKVETDRTVVLNITGVYDGQAAAAKTCSLYIVNNAFVEFQYKNRETYEAAGTYKIPVLVTGELKEATTFTVRVKEGGTAMEGTHFILPQTVFTLEPGVTSAEVEIELTDDTEANEDRWFDLEIVSVTGSNAVVGRSIPLCRVTIISEEVAKAISFENAKYSVVEGDSIYIPLVLDKAPAAGEATVQVTISIKSTSIAKEGTDFTIENKVLNFVPGQKMEEIAIKALANGIVDADRTFEIYIKAAAGANIGTMDACSINIQNKDFPAFSQEVYKVEEDYGQFIIPVTLPTAPASDIVLNLHCVEGSAIPGTHYTLESNEIQVKAGETTGNIILNIGYTEKWTDIPSFHVAITGTNGSDWEITPDPIKVELEQCAFRKLLGEWTMTSEIDNCKTPCDIVITSVEWQKEIHVVEKQHMWSEHDTYYNCKYDKNTNTLTMLLQQRCEDHNWNYGASNNNNVVMRYIIDGKLGQQEQNLNYNPDNLSITLPAGVRLGGGGYQNNQGDAPVVYGFFRKNSVMTKK